VASVECFDGILEMVFVFLDVGNCGKEKVEVSLVGPEMILELVKH